MIVLRYALFASLVAMLIATIGCKGHRAIQGRWYNFDLKSGPIVSGTQLNIEGKVARWSVFSLTLWDPPVWYVLKCYDYQLEQVGFKRWELWDERMRVYILELEDESLIRFQTSDQDPPVVMNRTKPNARKLRIEWERQSGSSVDET